MNEQNPALPTSAAEAPAPTGAAFLALDWSKLLHGDVVWIRYKGRLTNLGRVDAMSPDGSVLWVMPNGISTRKMHYREDGEELWSLRQTADDAPTADPRILTAHPTNRFHHC